MLSGRDFVTPDDVKAMVPACLRHRVMLRPEIEIEGMDGDALLADVLATVPVPR
jgi:MoxR-like ATPase